MANSSDWIEQLSRAPETPPGWFDGLGEAGGFVEGLPFARRASPVETAQDTSTDEAQSAIEIARQEGEIAGRAAAEAEWRESEEARRALRLSFRALDQAAIDALSGEIAETVIALCNEVIGECTIDREGLEKRAREAARLLGTAPEQMRLHLHPGDIELLGGQDAQGWQIVPDPDLPRGALRLEGADGEVHDGPDQWRRAIAEAVRG